MKEKNISGSADSDLVEDRCASVLEGVPVDDKAFPLRVPPKGGSSTKDLLSIVGHCPTCGWPIFGKQYLQRGREPEIQHSCTCRMQQSFDELVSRK